MHDILTPEDIEREEIEALENEYQWVLKEEVQKVLKELNRTLLECVNKFPLPLCGNEKVPEMEKFVLSTQSTTPSDQVKVIATITGDSITHADVNLKLPRGSGNKDLYQNTSVREDCPWKLQQLQDAGNHLQIAVQELKSVDEDYQFTSVTEVVAFLSRVMVSIQRGRSALVNPRKRTLEELHNSKYLKGLSPPVPPELALSFYLQSWKLIFAVYHIVNERGVQKFNRYQAECVIPWVNDVLLLMTIALQTAQQLKDKISVFSQYQDLPAHTPTSSSLKP